MGIRIEGDMERVNGKEVSYSEFVERYMDKNQPVVVTGLMDDWRACKDWVIDNGKPNLHFFSTHFGNSTVQVLIFSSIPFCSFVKVPFFFFFKKKDMFMVFMLLM